MLSYHSLIIKVSTVVNSSNTVTVEGLLTVSIKKKKKKKQPNFQSAMAQSNDSQSKWKNFCIVRNDQSKTKPKFIRLNNTTVAPCLTSGAYTVIRGALNA